MLSKAREIEFRVIESQVFSPPDNDRISEHRINHLLDGVGVTIVLKIVSGVQLK